MFAGLPLDHRPVLEGQFVSLRRPVYSDVFDIFSILSDREVARFLSLVPHPYKLADAVFFIDQIVSEEWVWAINLPGSSKLSGAISLMPKDGYRGAELGFWLSRDHWGRGIMTEAARLTVSYGFDELGLDYITSGCFEENVASARVLTKLGFIETGRGMRPGPLGSGGAPGISAILHSPRRAPSQNAC